MRANARRPTLRSTATPLRRSFERARTLDPRAQFEACVEQLSRPALLVEQVLEACREMRARFELDSREQTELEEAPQEEVEEILLEEVLSEEVLSEERGEDAQERVVLSQAVLECGAHEDDGDTSEPTLVEEFFWETRELVVLGDPGSFTCLATNVDPLGRTQRCGDGLSTGIDYVGVTCDPSLTLVLGAVQAPGDYTAYPLLLRLLACLSELAPASIRARLSSERLRGIARESSRFDLNLVLWDRTELAEASPISELTRDLAEHVKRAIVAASDFPPILRDVVGLRMNPDRFDGRLRCDWRV